MTVRSLLAFLLLSLLTGCADRAAKLPVYDTVPPFSMLDSKGNGFDSRELAGHIWVADFIYTTCPAECPMMTSRMHGVEKQLKNADDVRLVSISVDPEHDTPPVLDNFARRYGGPTRQWTFLTGTPATVHQLAYTTFHVGDVIGKISHSTKFILVDQKGRIRGYYSTLDKDGIPALLDDIAALRSSHS